MVRVALHSEVNVGRSTPRSAWAWNSRCDPADAHEPRQKSRMSPFPHIAGQNDDLVKVAPLLGMVEGWSAFLAEETATEHVELLRLHERTGRPR